MRQKNLNLSANKLYHLYYFKCIDSLYKRLREFQKSKVFNYMGRKFLNKLSENLVTKSNQKYEDEKANIRQSVPKVLNFSAQVQNPKKKTMEMMRSNPAKFMTPHLFNFLDDLFKRRKRWAFSNLHKHQKDSQGKDKLVSHVNNSILGPKKGFFLGLQQLALYNSRTPALKCNLFKLLRGYWIRKVTNAAPGCGRIVRMMYCLEKIESIKQANRISFLRIIARKWRFQCTMKLVAKAKMEAMYKNMQLSYLNMTNELFGENVENPGVLKEFEDLGGRMGMFNGHSTEVIVSKQQFTTTKQSKTYYKSVPVSEEYHLDSNPDLGESSEYYYDGGVGDSTQGRYKSETPKNNNSRKN